MTWRTRVGLAGWLLFGCYVWVAEPALMAAVLLYAMVVAMLALAAFAIARGAKRKSKAKW